MNLQEPLGKGLKSIMRVPSSIFDHANTTEHLISIDNCHIGGGNHNLARAIKKAMFIRVDFPSHIRNIGNYQLVTHKG